MLHLTRTVTTGGRLKLPLLNYGGSRLSLRFLSTPSRPLSLELFRRAQQHGDRTAIVDAQGTHSYTRLLSDSAALSNHLVATAGKNATESRDFPVAFLCPRDYSYAQTQWAIWHSGGIAVPLCDSHPPAEWEYYIRDSQAAVVVAHPSFQSKLQPVAEACGVPLLPLSAFTPPTQLSIKPQEVRAPNENAQLIYTSGTTGKPKGVLTTHSIIQSQITSLVDAWEWTKDDRIAHVLPLHHVHGVVNVLLCALWSGAVCDMHLGFNAATVWSELTGFDATKWTPTLKGDIPLHHPRPVAPGSSNKANLFMAVPTIYAKLTEYFEKHVHGNEYLAGEIREACKRNVRLMVSGSAPLPVTVMQQWQALTGHVLLERYGMTEIGMALSNNYHGKRYPGAVGFPLPGVETRIVREEGRNYVDVKAGESGELWVKGPTVFTRYWNKPEATAKAFHDGWFLTGDEASCTDGLYRILGRASADIIKTGGYKVSALEIENVILDHPSVKEVAVVGVKDDVWGERVGAIISFKSGKELSLDEVKSFCKDHLASYKLPTLLHRVESIPRNAMGKVNKKQLVKMFD
eukprot:comp19602_c1_seq1/m.23079 comp19602_c1_seq1/g.23079  ORF comp19602_c1_seq1/g.23079 comp19602_c1_seq1/m.23079 type:complete len:573 (-) comp19602_c1_seq1:167-1885(-)